MKKEISISGMSCKHCVMHVNNALMELEGVVSVNVNLESAMAVLETRDTVADEVITAAIEEAGYEVKAIREVEH